MSIKKFNEKKLSLKKFNGDLMKWKTFWYIRVSRPEESPVLTNIDKFSYLHSLIELAMSKAVAGLTLL